MKLNWLFSTAGLVFVAGVVILVVAERKKKAATMARNTSVADESAAQLAKAAVQHIDVDYVGGVVH